MEIGIDEKDFIDDLDDFDGDDPRSKTDDSEPEGPEGPIMDIDDPNPKGSEPEEDFITSLLKSRGIEDRSKIKFENDEGAIEEVDWDSLNNEDKLNILNSSSESSETDLDDSEILLINTIRESGLTASEYIQNIESKGVERYIQNSQNEQYQYAVDQYSDDELFVADFISRMGDVTDEEAQEALEKAKSNEALFAKLIGAIRNEYKMIEEENLRQAQIEEEQQAQEQYNQFALSVVEQINNFTELQGYDLNLEQEDMLLLYDFITGFDAAGNNHFAKALSDPKILVQTAWFALNGKQMIDDITDYFLKEITQVRKESYAKGVSDTQNKINKSNIVFRNKPINSQETTFSDLDEF